MNRLEELELEELENLQEEEKKRFEITDLGSLNWAFRKLKAYKTKEQEITDLAKEERDRIDYWERKEKKSIQDGINFFEMLISQYHAKELAKDPKVKTISTPYGKSKSRRAKEQVTKLNEKEILQYVIENEMNDYIKPTLKWADLKKSLNIATMEGKKVVVDENGQIIVGVGIEPEQIKYTVEAD